MLAHLSEVFEEAELTTVDARYALRGGSGAPSRIVVVAIDDGTLAAVEESWPVPPAVHARLLDALAGADPSVIAYDVPYDRSSDGDPDLLASLVAAGDVVLAYTQVSDDGTPLVLGGAEALTPDGVRAGDGRFDPDDDGSLRRFDHTLEAGPTFPIVVTEVGLGEIVGADRIGDEGATIDFAGPSGSVETVSAAAVLDGAVDASVLRDAIVVVGPTAPRAQDLFQTPLDERMAGVEVQANMIATVASDFPLGLVGPSPAVMLVAAACAVPALGASRLSPSAGILTAGVAAAGYLAFAQVAFVNGMIVPVVAPVVGLSAAAAAIIAINYAYVAAERRRVRSVFGRFVPEHVVRQAVEAHPDGTGDLLRAETSDVTVLFSDIRGFTTFSENREPDEVLSVLNDYLGAMTDVVIDAGGTLVNYMGDGIMAVFGAPDPDDDHAETGLAAARGMLLALDDFNRRCDPTGDGTGFEIGIGLNSGRVVAGNIGTARRLVYTMIGDTVNTAARIEGMTKTAPGDVLVADATVRRLSEPPADLVSHGTLDVRGRNEPIDLWVLAVPAS